jgi:hypothetical protein
VLGLLQPHIDSFDMHARLAVATDQAGGVTRLKSSGGELGRLLRCDLQRCGLLIRDGKGHKDRRAMFHDHSCQPWRRPAPRAQYQRDVIAQVRVELPTAISRKLLRASDSCTWRWAFSAMRIYLSHAHLYLYIHRWRAAAITSTRVSFPAVAQAVRAAGISKRTAWNTFRRSFATYLLDRGHGIRTSQDLPGHRDASMTEIYTHLHRGPLGVQSPLDADCVASLRGGGYTAALVQHIRGTRRRDCAVQHSSTATARHQVGSCDFARRQTWFRLQVAVAAEGSLTRAIMEHWRYFQALERDFERTIQYVEPCAANYGTYSVEYAKILLGTCSEIDVVAKVLIGVINPGANPANIHDYRNEILSRYPRFHTSEVVISRYSLRIVPWSEWGLAQPLSPTWWRNYNNVKHQRHNYYSQANLENCLSALSGLFSMILYLYHHQLFDHELGHMQLFEIPQMASPIVYGHYSLPDLNPGARGPNFS